MPRNRLVERTPSTSQRLAVGLGRVLDRRSVADMAVHQDQGGALVLGSEDVQAPGDRIEVVGVRHGGDVPS